MGIQGAFGTKLKIDVSAELTVVAHLLDVDPLVMRKLLAKATGHDAAGGYDEYYDTGSRSIPALKITLGWDDADTTHTALTAAFVAKEPVNATLEDPAGNEVISFKTHVMEIGRQYKQNDIYKALVVLQPTGQPTIA